uniref:Uncharacterized protein n=1 Tax=viral metagenome TaxID=1070528 RepID=A0A6H1ZD24_9ZZZZ
MIRKIEAGRKVVILKNNCCGSQHRKGDIGEILSPYYEEDTVNPNCFKVSHPTYRYFLHSYKCVGPVPAKRGRKTNAL